MKIEDRLGACAIVYGIKDDKVLMGLRSDTHKWSFAGGKAEKEDNNDLLRTAVRELKEEFGVKLNLDDENFSYFDLEHAVVPGYKRVKHENSSDTFEETFYKTQIFVFVFYDIDEVKKYMISNTDGEMSALQWVKTDDIFDLDKLMPSTVSVYNVARLYLKTMRRNINERCSYWS